MIPLEETADGVIVSVKGQPGARRNAIVGVHDGALKVAVCQAPEKGKATTAILEVLATSLGLKKSQIELVSGPTSVHKKVLVRTISSQQLLEKLTAILNLDG